VLRVVLLDRLVQRLEGGTVLVPGSAGFDAARLGFNSRFDAVVPQAIVYCATAADIARTLAFTAGNGMEVAVRSGGHCFGGHSSSTGVVIDVSPMTSVRLDGDVAAIGAGARLGHVYAELDGPGRTIPGGTCPPVGIAGLTLGGGLGILGRQYGVTSDRLTAARVVLASGEILDCDEHRHPDLFWALRGGGAGNFGVVTSLSLRTVPAPAGTWNGHLTWPEAAAGDVITAWQQWAPAAPGPVAASLKITTTGDPGTAASVDVYVTGFGPYADARITDALIGQAGVLPVSVTGERGPFPAARRFWAELGDHPDQPDSGPPARPFLFSRSEFFTAPLPGEAIGALLTAFTADREPGVSRELDFMPWGGAYRNTSADATAFVHRDGLFQLKHSAVVGPPTSEERSSRAHRWVTRSWDSVHPWGSGHVFPNFADPDLQAPGECYYGHNLPRLKRIKRHYDPGNTFGSGQSIPLA